VWLAPLGDIARHVRGLALKPRAIPKPDLGGLGPGPRAIPKTELRGSPP
jgi:hypothetical protein